MVLKYNNILLNRMIELIERANSGILIVLCGNKLDLEERQVSYEVIELIY
jgi:hypothetical protein